MNKFRILMLLSLIICFQSCQKNEMSLTEKEKSDAVSSARKTVEKIFEYSNNLDFLTGLSLYSEDSKVYFTSNGNILSLQDLKDSYQQIGNSVEVLENSIDSWNATILSKDIVAFTLPIHLKFKLKNIPEYNGQLVWTGIVQKKEGKWLVVQSHESWLNCVEVSQALTSADNN